jgi:hypothetical protein
MNESVYSCQSIHFRLSHFHRVSEREREREREASNQFDPQLHTDYQPIIVSNCITLLQLDKQFIAEQL